MFENCIIIGTGKLPYMCAREAIKKNISCIIYEYNEFDYSLLESLCEKNEILYEKVSKESLINKLKYINKRTLVVSANNIFIFPNEIVKNENLFIINFHPALLPKHPGRNAEAWSIYEGDEESGITWHIVNEKIDDGEIIIQKRIRLTKEFTSLKLMILQIQIAFEGFKEVLSMLLNANFTVSDKKNITNTSKYKIHLSRDIPNDGLLDTEWSIDKISAFLRAMDYGKMNIMGTPRCKIGDKFYIWDKYTFQLNEKGELTNIQNGILADDKLIIKLIGFREEDKK